MPRQARMDVRGALHHVMGRGIERRTIFCDQEDRNDFLKRLAQLAEKGSWIVYAWALMPNHFHLLVRSAKSPLSIAMRSLMSGYAGYFNRQHHRIGHVFQNRFKSVLCEEDPYFLELVRYIHLNPLRGGLVKSIVELDKSPLTGHSTLMGEANRPWQETDEVLKVFSGTSGRARRAYRTYVEEGLKEREPTHLEGGGLIRSVGGWRAVMDLQRGREKYLSDERVLGSSGFVEDLIQEAEKIEERRVGLLKKWSVQTLVDTVCQRMNVDPVVLSAGGKDRSASRAREGLAYLWVRRLGMSGRELTRRYGMKPTTVYLAAKRGESRSEQWDVLLNFS